MKFIIISLTCLFSFSALAKSNLEALPKKDRLGKMARGIDTRWGDENITNCGQTTVQAFRVKGELAEWNDTMSVLIKKNYGDDYKPDGELAVETQKFNKSIVKDVVNALMMSNDYDPENEETRELMTRTVWALLRQLNIKDSVEVVTAKVKVSGETCDTQDVESYLFINTKTQKAIHFFASQGFM